MTPEMLIVFGIGAVLGASTSMAVALWWATSEVREVRREIEELVDLVKSHQAAADERARLERMRRLGGGAD